MKKLYFLLILIFFVLISCTPKSVVSFYMKSVMKGNPNEKILGNYFDSVVAPYIVLDYEVLTTIDREYGLDSSAKFKVVKTRVTFESEGGFEVNKIINFHVVRFSGSPIPKIHNIEQSGTE